MTNGGNAGTPPGRVVRLSCLGSLGLVLAMGVPTDAWGAADKKGPKDEPASQPVVVPADEEQFEDEQVEGAVDTAAKKIKKPHPRSHHKPPKHPKPPKPPKDPKGKN